MLNFITQFATILFGLRAEIAAQAARDRARTALLVLVWGRIGRMGTRLEKLFARWRANTLPNRTLLKPRPSRAGESRTPREMPHLPTGHAWLVVIMGYDAAGRGSQLQHLLAHPDLPEFLDAAPQAGRILRPLCRMLGVIPPPQLLRPEPPPLDPTQPPARGAQLAAPAEVPPAGSRPPRRPSRHMSATPALRFSPA